MAAIDNFLILELCFNITGGRLRSEYGHWICNYSLFGWMRGRCLAAALRPNNWKSRRDRVQSRSLPVQLWSHVLTVMNIPPSTPFPVPSFQNADSDASPKQFLDFLRNLIAENFQDDDPSITKPASERDNWVTIVNGLSEHFLASFPSSNAVPWNAMHDKLELIDHTLEIITRVTSRVEAAYAGPGDAAKALFTHLLNLCNALDCWLDVEVTNEPGVPTPLQLRDKTVKAIVGLLRHLGSCISSGAGPDSPAWKNLREIMVECLDLTCGM